MVIVQINGAEKNLTNVDSKWIDERLQHQRGVAKPRCVRVVISYGRLNIVLVTPNCEDKCVPGRTASSEERQFFDLWNSCGLNKEDFKSRHVVEFLSKLRRVL